MSSLIQSEINCFENLFEMEKGKVCNYDDETYVLR